MSDLQSPSFKFCLFRPPSNSGRLEEHFTIVVLHGGGRFEEDNEIPILLYLETRFLDKIKIIQG